MPDGLHYHGEHTWVKIESDGNVRIGMDDFYQKLAGETTYIDLPFEGDEVQQGETYGKIQSAKWVGKIVAPVTGEILEVNNALEDDRTLINRDPYGEGWIAIIKPSNLEEELRDLYHGENVEPWLRKEIEKAKKLKG